MSLYSSDAFSNAEEGNPENGPVRGPVPEGRACLPGKEKKTWCYLFVRRSKVDYVNEKLKRRFNTFIHTSVSYKREHRHVQKEERPTISGLIFVQGDSRKIRAVLDDIFPGLHLATDCSTHRTAVIGDDVMQSFIQLARVGTNRIRFLSHSLDYYATGHPLVRITSGQLAGFEGFQIRISRDKCLVTSLGGLTVAIGGVSKETFENIGEYVQMRRKEQEKEARPPRAPLTPLQQEMDRSLFRPQNQLDVLVLARSLDTWLARAGTALQMRRYRQAAEMALFLLERLGAYVQPRHGAAELGPIDALRSAVRQLLSLLSQMELRPDVPADLAAAIRTGRQSLACRYFPNGAAGSPAKGAAPAPGNPTYENKEKQ